MSEAIDNRPRHRRQELTKAILDNGGSLPMANFILGHTVVMYLSDRLVKAKLTWDGNGTVEDVLSILELNKEPTP